MTPGARVITREGVKGTVTAVSEDGYLVTLDAGLGGGSYTANEIHLASDDYPELGDILVDRPPLQRVASLHVADDVPNVWSIMNDSQERYPNRSHGELGYCALCGKKLGAQPYSIEVSLDGKVIPPGHPDSGSSESQGWWDIGSECRKLFPPEYSVKLPPFEGAHTASIFDRVVNKGLTTIDEHAPADWKYKPGNNPSFDWCRFRHDERCMYPKDLNTAATQQAGYNVWIPFDRGYCWRSVWDDQRACPVSEPGPNSGDPHALVDATVPWDQGGQRTNMPGVSFDDQELAAWKSDALRHGSHHDGDFSFHFTATWRDVRDKAKHIRSEGGVDIISVPDTNQAYITAHVKGTTAVYETRIMRSIGGRSVATWECGCDWAKYSWGRSGRWKRFEGRMCSHALALVYEAQSREMFGGQLSESDGRPEWGPARQPDNTKPQRQQYPRAASYQPPLARTADLDPIEPSPAVMIARGMLEDGYEVKAVLSVFREFGDSAIQIVSGALAMPFTVRYGDELRQVVDLDGNRLKLISGEEIPADAVTHPDYHPTLGLDPTVAAVRTLELIDTPLADASRGVTGGNRGSMNCPRCGHGEHEHEEDGCHCSYAEDCDCTLSPGEFKSEWKKRDAERTSVLAADSADMDGIMVAIAPPQSVVEALGSIPETTEDLDNMHVTLGYFGKSKDVDAGAILAAVQAFAENTATPLTGHVQGFGQFLNPGSFVLYAAVDVPGLEDWREKLIKTLAVYGVSPLRNHGFTPHLTLAYADEPFTSFPEMPKGANSDFVLSEIIYAQGADWKRIPVMGHLGTPEGPPVTEFAVAAAMQAEAGSMPHGFVPRVGEEDRCLWCHREPSFHAHSEHPHYGEGAESTVSDRTEASLYEAERSEWKGNDEPETLFVLQSSLDGRFSPARFTSHEKAVEAAGPFDTVRRLDEVLRETGREGMRSDWKGNLPTRDEATLHEEPEPALPSTDGEIDMEKLRAGLAWLKDDVPQEDGIEIAAAAQQFLAKQGMRDFSPIEQRALIEEGEGVVAANLGSLDIAGTHYEVLEATLAAQDDAADDELMWLS